MNFLLPSLAWWMDVSMACLQEYPLCGSVTRRLDPRCRKCSHDQLWHQLNSRTAQGHVEQPNARLREDTSPGRAGSERGRDHSSLSSFLWPKWHNDLSCACLSVSVWSITHALPSLFWCLFEWMRGGRQRKENEVVEGVIWSVSLKTEGRGNWMAVDPGPSSWSGWVLTQGSPITICLLVACADAAQTSYYLTSATGLAFLLLHFRSGQAADHDSVQEKMISGGQWG